MRQQGSAAHKLLLSLPAHSPRLSLLSCTRLFSFTLLPLPLQQRNRTLLVRQHHEMGYCADSEH